MLLVDDKDFYDTNEKQILMAQLHLYPSLPAQRDHDQTRWVSYTYQPPFVNTVSMSTQQQSSCQESASVPCPQGVFAPIGTTCRWNKECVLETGMVRNRTA